MAVLLFHRQPIIPLRLIFAGSLSSNVVRQQCSPLALSYKSRNYSKPASLLSGERDVRIFEVGPRDGLQDIKEMVPTETKIELIRRLAVAGIQDIEATSFVSPKWVPQLADGAEIMRRARSLTTNSKQRFSVLAPNLKGFENAMKSEASEVVVFASASQAFSKANQNCTIDEALAQAESVATRARDNSILVRG